MRTLRAGLVGFGYAGATFHGPLIEAAQGWSLHSIVTTQCERAEAKFPGARLVKDVSELLSDHAVEVVVIATPNETHMDLARQVLMAGRHVVVDKPVALASDDILALWRLAEDQGKLLVPFHNRRYDGDFLTIRELIAAGSLGKVTGFESHFDRFRPKVPSRWREHPEKGGGLLYDLGTHLIDQVLHLFGLPTSVQATLAHHRNNAVVDDYVHVLLSYPETEVIVHATALAALESPRFLVHGTQGSYRKLGLDGQEAQLLAGVSPNAQGFGKNLPGLLRRVGGAEDETIPHPTLDGNYLAFYQQLYRAIVEGQPPPVTADEARLVAKIIELARRSHASGTRLQLH